MNKLFTFLPLAALVNNEILCVHSGIGVALNYLNDIENLKRPIEIKQIIENSSE